MTVEQLKQDLGYVAAAVSRHDQVVGIPSLYFLWSVLILVGYALPDLAPQIAGPYWIVACIGGGLLSWWLAERDDRRRGVRDREQGRRWGLHWLVGGIAFFLTALPMMLGRVPAAQGATQFVFITGLLYALLGVHLLRPLLWCGLLMLAAYAIMTVLMPPHVWTISGVIIAAALCWSGFFAMRARRAGALP
jgi:hypothetical protein